MTDTTNSSTPDAADEALSEHALGELEHIDPTSLQIDRIVHQIVTNDQKRDLTDAQRARGIQQMIDAGLSVTKVAKIHRLKYAPCIVARPSVSAEVQIPAGASC